MNSYYIIAGIIGLFILAFSLPAIIGNIKSRGKVKYAKNAKKNSPLLNGMFFKPHLSRIIAPYHKLSGVITDPEFAVYLKDKDKPKGEVRLLLSGKEVGIYDSVWFYRHAVGEGIDRISATYVVVKKSKTIAGVYLYIPFKKGSEWISLAKNQNTYDSNQGGDLWLDKTGYYIASVDANGHYGIGVYNYAVWDTANIESKDFDVQFFWQGNQNVVPISSVALILNRSFGLDKDKNIIFFNKGMLCEFFYKNKYVSKNILPIMNRYMNENLFFFDENDDLNTIQSENGGIIPVQYPEELRGRIEDCRPNLGDGIHFIRRGNNDFLFDSEKILWRKINTERLEKDTIGGTIVRLADGSTMSLYEFMGRPV